MNGIADAASTKLYTTHALVIATPWFIDDDDNYTTPRFGDVNVYTNDLMDSDQDGVGNLLEAALTTCSVAGGCTPAHHLPHDSDRDGLADAEELFGMVGIKPDGTDDVAFPRWGADVKHKDLFVEVDHKADIPAFGGMAAGQDPFKFMRNNPGTHGFFGDYNNDGHANTLEGWVDSVRAPFLLAPAVEVGNPDGLPGINVHLDVGVTPLNRFDEAKFGDYGSTSSRRHVSDWYVELKEKPDGRGPLGDLWVLVYLDGVYVGYAYVLGSPTSETACQYMNRLAIAITFRPWLGVILRESVCNGVSPPTEGWASRMRLRAADGSTTFELQFISTNTADLAARLTEGREGSDQLPPDDAYNARTVGRYHYAPEQFDEARRYKFRYAIIGGEDGGNTVFEGLEVGLLDRQFIHEFGHSVGLAHWGRSEWSPGNNVRDAECLPQYRSTMSYAYNNASSANHTMFPPRFASEETLKFNPARPREMTGPFGIKSITAPFATTNTNNSKHYWNMTLGPWFYASTASADFWRSAAPGTGSLDLDRSMNVSSGIVGSSIGLMASASECKAFSHGETILSGGDGDPRVNKVRGSVDLVRYGSWLYAFFARDSYNNIQLGVQSAGLFYMRAPLGTAANKGCTGSAAPFSGGPPCLTWSTPTRLTTGLRRHTSAHVWNSQIYLATTIPTSGYIEVRRYSVNASNGLLSSMSIAAVPTNSNMDRTLDAPELTILQAFQHPPALMLLYREKGSTADRPLRARTYDSTNNTWSSTRIQRERIVTPNPIPNLPDIVTFPDISVARAPGALAWPFRLNTDLPLNERRTLGLFPRPPGTSGPAAAMYVLCNDATCTADEPVGCVTDDLCKPDNPVWVESDFLESGDSADGQASLAYKFVRDQFGERQSNASGHLMVSRHVDTRPFMTVSEWASRTRRPGEASTILGWNTTNWKALHTGDWFLNSFTQLGNDGNLALYSDAEVANVFGLSSMGADSELTFWPHADGAPDQEFRMGSDFKVMQGEVCRMMRVPRYGYSLIQPTLSVLDANEYCGTFSVGVLAP